ncbi:hypothetical protein bcgnr5378_65420 [Bacillus cereus]
MDINKDFLYTLCDGYDSFSDTEYHTLRLIMLYVEDAKPITNTTYEEKCRMLERIQYNWMRLSREHDKEDYYTGCNMLEEIKLILEEKIIYEIVQNTKFRMRNPLGIKIEDLYMLLLEREKEQKNTLMKDVISISEIKKYIEDELGYKPMYISRKEHGDREFKEIMERLLPEDTSEKTENVIDLHNKQRN